MDWGDEGGVLSHVGIGKVYSFHMTLSWSRDPFCCFTTSADLGTFFDCHRRAFAHFGGVPAVLVYDRTKTVVKRHVAPGAAVPLHPQAAAFADHYGFAIDVLAAYRPSGNGRVERQVDIVREHVLVGRGFDGLAQMDAAFTGWVPIPRGEMRRTHGEQIGARAGASSTTTASSRRPRAGPLRRTQLPRLAPPHHPHRPRPSLLHPVTPRPKSACAGLTIYVVVRELKQLPVVMTGACHVCRHPFPDDTS